MCTPLRCPLHAAQRRTEDVTDERSKQPAGAQDDVGSAKDTPRVPVNPFASARPPGRISLEIAKVPAPARPSTAPLPSIAQRPGAQEVAPPTLDDVEGDGGLEEDSDDMPTGNLSADAIPGLEHMRIGASASWDDDTLGESDPPPLVAPSLTAEEPTGDFPEEHTVALDPGFDDGFAPIGLSSNTDVEDIEDIEEGDVFDAPDDDDADPTTNISAEDVEQALRMSGAFDAAPRPAEPAPAPAATPRSAPAQTPGPAPSPRDVEESRMPSSA